MKLLCVTDGSKHAQDAFELVRRLPLPSETEVTLLTVMPDLGLPDLQRQNPGAYAELNATLHREADRLLARAGESFRGTGWRLDFEKREGQAAAQILEAASETRCDLIVMGSRGLSGLTRYLLGGVSHRVVRHSPCSVLLGRSAVESADSTGPLRLLVAHDGSAPSTTAVRSLAKFSWNGAHALLVRVLTLLTYFRMDVLQRLGSVFQEQEREALEGLEKTAALLAKSGCAVETKLLEGADPADLIVETAQRDGSDLLVMGDRGLGAVESYLLGSIASKLVHHAPCSTLIVKGKGL